MPFFSILIYVKFVSIENIFQRWTNTKTMSPAAEVACFDTVSLDSDLIFCRIVEFSRLCLLGPTEGRQIIYVKL